MSKGMWTKHFTLEGKEFYFNASQNRSLWTPPSDSIIHRAPNLKPPESIEEKGDSMNSVSQVQTQSLELENGEIPNIIASQPPPPPGLPPHKLPEIPQSTVSEQQKNQQMIFDFQAKIDEALKKHDQLLNNKSKKPVDSNDNSKPQQSEYLKQKSEFESQLGGKSEESSKWLVR